LVVMKRQPGFSLIHVLKYLQEHQYDLIIAKDNQKTIQGYHP
jgi:hypothetical protein